MNANVLLKVSASSRDDATLKAEELLDRYVYREEIFTDTTSVFFEEFYDWIFPEDIPLHLSAIEKRVKFEVLPSKNVIDKLAGDIDGIVEKFFPNELKRSELIKYRSDVNMRVYINVDSFDYEFLDKNLANDNVKLNVKYSISGGCWLCWQYGEFQYLLPEIFQPTDGIVTSVLTATKIKAYFRYILYKYEANNEWLLLNTELLADSDIEKFLLGGSNDYFVNAEVQV